MRKYIKWSILLYLLFVFGLYLYIFQFADTSIPGEYKSTSADPETFMTERQLVLSEEYSQVRNYLFFMETPLEWLIYFLILASGLSMSMEKSSDAVSRFRMIQRGTYLFYLSVLSFVAYFPLNYISYRLSRKYQISNQEFTPWFREEIMDFWVNFGTTLVIVLALFYFIQKSAKKWWLYMWLASIPFTLFFMFVKPVVIDPLYNDFYPLKDKELETKILTFAEQANIPADHVYEVDMAAKTNAMNAYVTGIGGNSRIVLWDTTLQKLEEREILFIMAHEMAHYVEKHIYIGIALYLILGLAGFWLTARMMEYIINRWGDGLRVKSVNSSSALLVFLCIFSFLSFVSSPFSNAVSRYQETRADAYAMKITNDPEAAVKTFQELSKSSLSQVNPPGLVKIFRYSHPTMLERISSVEQSGDEGSD
ncbi:MAG: M48 family metallopeptidase [Bacillus sp. (in: firmicutes)]